MGILFYNKPPGLQLFYNGSFELPLNTGRTFLNWYLIGDVERQNIVVAFGDWAARVGASGILTQEGPHLPTSGSIVVSILVRGASTSSLQCTYSLLDTNDTVIFSRARNFIVASNSDFNNTYGVFNLPTGLGPVTAKVTFQNIGSGDVFLDNSKNEAGKSPTRYSASVNPGDPEVIVPSTFSVAPEVNDPNDPFLPPINLRRASSQPSQSGEFTAPDTLRDGSSAGGDQVIGGDPSSAYDEYQKFSECIREIHKCERDQIVNRTELKAFPQDKDTDFLKFTRDDLKKKIDDYAKIGSIQRMALLFAKNKMASYRRAFEARAHSRLDYYSFGFIDKRLNDRYIRNEDGAIREISGAG